MFGRASPQARIDTLIGKSTRIHGDIEFSGGLHIDGQVSGNVRAVEEAGSSLAVSESGCIEGSVLAAHVLVNGTVRGDIYARDRVALGTGARVHGNVYYGLIESASGAEIRGTLIPLIPQEPAEPAAAEPHGGTPGGSPEAASAGSQAAEASPPASDSAVAGARFDPVAGAS